MELLILFAVLIGVTFLTSQMGKKKQVQQRQAMEEQLAPGVWILTYAGFYGKLVEVDGGVVILESLTGEESIWSKGAIKGIQDPPFAEAEENSSVDEVTDAEIDALLETEHADVDTDEDDVEEDASQNENEQTSGDKSTDDTPEADDSDGVANAESSAEENTK